MKYKLLLQTIIFQVLFIGVIAAQQGPSSKDIPTRELVEDYLMTLKTTMVKGASQKDINHLLNLYTDNVIYEHKRFGAKVSGKKQITEGMLTHLNDYQGTEQNTRFEVINITLGYNIAIVEYWQIFKVKDGKSSRDIKRRKLTILLYDGTLINRITDYE